MLVTTEINIFQPNSRKREATIESLIPKQAVDVLEERLGKAAAKQATEALEVMKAKNIDLLQFRVGDRRVRIKQSTQLLLFQHRCNREVLGNDLLFITVDQTNRPFQY